MANPDKKQTDQSLRVSFLDGIFASLMGGFTLEYFAPFLLLLGATAKHIGMLTALPNLFSSLIQLKSADITNRFKSRKKLIAIFILLQDLTLVPMALAALLKWGNPYFFIAAVVLFTCSGAFVAPAWLSLMSDLVAEGERGRYFGWRNRALGFIIVGATLTAGLVLQIMKKFDIFLGFTIIFSFAFIFRMISWYFFCKMKDPAAGQKEEESFSLFDFLKQIRKSNFAKFVIFVSGMSFSVNLAAPFFAVFMLRDMRFGYFLYTIITISATLMVYSVIERWGAHADRLGNLKIIRFVSPLIGIIPLFWIFNHHPVFLIIVQLFSGFAWAGFNLCAANFIYDAVTPRKRTRCISYFNVLNGLAISSGAILGGFLLNSLPALLGYKVLTLFLISSVMRMAVSAYMLPKLKEVRQVERIKSNELFFSMIGARPLLGIDRKIGRY